MKNKDENSNQNPNLTTSKHKYINSPIKILLCLILLLTSIYFITLAGCSSSGKKEKAEKAQDTDISNQEVEFTSIPEESEKGTILAGSKIIESATESVASTNNTNSEEQDQNQNIQTYTVEKGDTYMWIAFKLYGNYHYWKNIASLNKGVKSLSKGTAIKYYPPKDAFSWNPKGSPYLIQIKDTLGLISKKVYQTPRHWKYIWDNNRPMIPNPNLIFAGFTLYYLPLDGGENSKVVK
ncbi:MAG: LysM peptidoglycan-binding domain-containing protein [Oligoflexia bacterium]|nr:LysM peptidoglycan-binding domain-containing protein [Oligoflexia bacterium]